MTSYTISPIWGAGAQLFDDNGNPLAGGKIYTYLAGTSTPAETYTTPIGNVANSNPIVANAAGRLTNEIWFPVSGAYKFVLKDANDVLIATYDNIPTTPQPPIVNDASSISYQPGYEVTAGNFTIGSTYLITSVGNTDFVAIGAAANVTGILFTATGVGSGTGTAEFSRTVQSKLQDSFTLEDFGAFGDWNDGTQTGTDDTAYIQAAFDYSTSTGATIYGVSGKNYRITSTLDSTSLFFNGNGCSIIKDFAGVGIEITGGAAGSTISNVTVTASTANYANNYSASATEHGIKVTGSRCYLTGVGSQGHKGAGFYFDNSTGNSNGSTMMNLSAGGNSLAGYYFSGGYASPDNAAVMRMSLEAYGNYGYGMYADANSALRACDIWIFSENNGLGAAFPASTHAVNIKRARQCNFWAYVEEATTGREMLLDTNTTGCYVWSTRRNTDADNGSGNMWQFGQIIYSPSTSRTITPITLSGDYARINQDAEYVQMPITGSGGTFGTLRGQGGSSSNQSLRMLSANSNNYLAIDNTYSYTNVKFSTDKSFSSGVDAPAVGDAKQVTFGSYEQIDTTGASIVLFSLPSGTSSCAGHVYVSCESSGSVTYSYIFYVYVSNGTLTATKLADGNSQGTTTATISQAGANVKLDIAYTGGIGTHIKLYASGLVNALNY